MKNINQVPLVGKTKNNLCVFIFTSTLSPTCKHTLKSELYTVMREKREQYGASTQFAHTPGK